MDYNIYDDVYFGMLKTMNSFEQGAETKNIEYRFDPELQTLVSRYHLHEVAGDGTDSQKAIRMVEWMDKHCFHNGYFGNNVERCGEKLLEYSFDQGKEHGINCYSLSIALTECLLGLGIRARTMFIMPMSPYDGDNHVVCEAYASDLHKWIMIDPTYGGYLTDKDGTILNLMEIRELLSNREEIFFSENYNYNGDKADFEWLKVYYAKDLFYLQCHQIQGYHTDDLQGNTMLTFAPRGFDVKQCSLANLEYRIKEMKKRGMAIDDAMEQYVQRRRSTSIDYQNPNILYQEAAK